MNGIEKKRKKNASKEKKICCIDLRTCISKHYNIDLQGMVHKWAPALENKYTKIQ